MLNVQNTKHTMLTT